MVEKQETFETLLQDQIDVCTNVSLLIAPADCEDVMSQVKRACFAAVRLWLRHELEALDNEYAKQPSMYTKMKIEVIQKKLWEIEKLM